MRGKPGQPTEMPRQRAKKGDHVLIVGGRSAHIIELGGVGRFKWVSMYCDDERIMHNLRPAPGGTPVCKRCAKQVEDRG